MWKTEPLHNCPWRVWTHGWATGVVDQDSCSEGLAWGLMSYHCCLTFLSLSSYLCLISEVWWDNEAQLTGGAAPYLQPLVSQNSTFSFPPPSHDHCHPPPRVATRSCQHVGSSLLPLLPVGDLGADAGRLVVGWVHHGILGNSMTVLSLPWPVSAIVHLTWWGSLTHPHWCTQCVLEVVIPWGAQWQAVGRGDGLPRYIFVLCLNPTIT